MRRIAKTMESIVASIITGVIAAFASVYAAHISNEKTVAVLNERIENVKQDISRLERKQDETNNVKIRLAVVEHDVNELKTS